jgi:hypothetical protein
MRDRFANGFAAAVADIRQKPRSQTITVNSPGEQSPGERLGWFKRDERSHQSPTPEHDRGEAAKDPKAQDRGIDL